MQAMPEIGDDALVLVLYGDVPLINPDTLRQLIASAGPKGLGLLTVMLGDITGYGRIVRNARGQIRKSSSRRSHARRAAEDPRSSTAASIAAPGQPTGGAGSLKLRNAQRYRASTI